MELVRIDGRYRLRRRLGSGSSGRYQDSHPVVFLSTHNYTGDIYVAHDIFSGQDIAVKLEPTRGACCTLEHEFHVYKKLAGGPGIPSVHLFGIERGYNVMVMDYLGPSLEQLFVHCHFQFSIKTVSLLASQLVSQLDSLPHS
jgi:serine/threonine protein kinase